MLDFFNESIRCVPMDSVPTQFRNFCSLCIGNRRVAKQTGAILPSPWPSSRRALWLMLCALLPLSSLMVEAAEQGTRKGPPLRLHQRPRATHLPFGADGTTSIRRQGSPSWPNAAQLKTRGLGAAFEKFNPSEAISADNAVPFPIDI